MKRADVTQAKAVEEGLELGPLDSSLGFLFRMAQVEIFGLFYDALGRLGLWVVHLNPGVRQGAVAETLRIKPAHMTKLVRAFEEGDMIVRHIPENDRRGIELRLTPQGEGFVTDHAEEFFTYARSEANRLSKKESEQLIHLLQKFTRLGGNS